MTSRRREALRLLTVGGAAAAVSPSLAVAAAKGKVQAMSSRMPTIFLAHGAPPLLDDEAWMSELGAWSQLLPRPRAVLMLSAHWQAHPVTLGATTTVPLVYDFYNFPRRFYEMKYPAPGAPALAERVRALLKEAGQPVADEPRRGLDHGAYVPMMAMYPAADVPVLQVSLPTLDPRTLFDLGRRLAPLRDEGVLIVGSGFLIHNLRAVDFSDRPSTPQWALEFDDFCAEKLFKGDADALIDYRARAPGVKLALPTHEHFVPVLAALGAADPGAKVTFPIAGFWGGSLTRRSAQFG